MRTPFAQTPPECTQHPPRGSDPKRLVGIHDGAGVSVTEPLELATGARRAPANGEAAIPTSWSFGQTRIDFAPDAGLNSSAGSQLGTPIDGPGHGDAAGAVADVQLAQDPHWATRADLLADLHRGEVELSYGSLLEGVT
jgi:hypothetical protein